MKTLHLLRHAKSSWDDPTLADHARPLARRGEREAAALAFALPSMSLGPELVLCSTAVRTRATYAAIAAALTTSSAPRYERGLYLASASALLRRLRRVPDAVSELLLIGHNPGLEDLALLLVRNAPEALRIKLAEQLPTCALLTLELELESWASLEPDTASLRRFWPLTAGAPPTKARAVVGARASRAPKLKLARSASWSELAEACLANARTHAYANVGCAAQGDVESVHQLRVALRRVRVVLRAFDDAFEPRAVAQAREHARDLFRVLGLVRELDVLIADWLAPLQSAAPRDPGLAALHARIAEVRSTRLREAQQQLHGPALEALTRAFDTLSVVESSPGKKPRARARRQLDKRLAVITELIRKAAGEDPEQLHLLRKELKKLRYRAELFAHLFDRDAARDYTALLARLQRTLGTMQDVVVARHALATLPAADGAREQARALALLGDKLAARERQVLAQLPRRLGKLAHASPFWH